ncbi:hypothetical protein PR048_026550 [Dryococelus australis]|uniref:Uncharacterized protein n=1 Tax=Dryococelus australis TaxID=614101 RepID=A0ABQ9GLQ3_9NEOP|nr:hypothetical protein PR048_026550 [Dryococelus australis]
MAVKKSQSRMFLMLVLAVVQLHLHLLLFWLHRVDFHYHLVLVHRIKPIVIMMWVTGFDVHLVSSQTIEILNNCLPPPPSYDFAWDIVQLKNLPLRGKEHHEGVLDDLFRFKIEAGDHILKEHIEKGTKNAAYVTTDSK